MDFLAITHNLNVSGHVLIWTYFTLVRGTRAQIMFTPFSYILYKSKCTALPFLEMFSFPNNDWILILIFTFVWLTWKYGCKQRSTSHSEHIHLTAICFFLALICQAQSHSCPVSSFQRSIISVKYKTPSHSFWTNSELKSSNISNALFF
jgi:hypothetical protein